MPARTTDTGVVFVAGPALDLLNAMYFTFLAWEFEGVAEWPVETRRRLDPALRDELDALFTFPRGQPGIVGALTDTNFVHPELWHSIDALLDYVRSMPADGTPDPARLGIRGLATYALRWPCDVDGDPTGPEPKRLSRRAFRDAVASDDTDADAALALYDDPEQLRARMLRLIRRFYDEHYRPDENRRMACLRRSVEAHRNDTGMDPEDLMRALTGRTIGCIVDAPGSYTRFVFVPSLDVGAYNSCADTPPVHGFYYRCEPRFVAELADTDEATQRLAMVYKALADEQRLRILRLLREGELYAQEIVDRTGIHQSVVSRHLSFMKAVGLVVARRQNNMKFFSLNGAMGDELRRAVDALLPVGTASARSG